MLPRFLTLVAALLAAVAASGAVAAASPPAVAWAVAVGVGFIGAMRPAVALKLLAAFAPLGGAIAALGGLPTSATEPLLLSVLAGWLLRRTLFRDTWDAAAVSLAGLLAMTVLASLAVQCAVAFQIAAPSGLSFPRALLQWLTQTSGVLGPQRPEVPAALRLLGGCGLFVMAVEVCRREPSTSAAALRLLILGVAAVAALNINRFLEVALRQGTDFWPAAWHVHQFLRVSSTIPDVNAAGALFALVLPSTAWLWLATARRRWIWSVAGVVLGAGLWLSGSRAAMTGGVIGVVGYLAMFAHRHWSWRRTVATLAVLVAIGTALVVWYPRAAAHTTSHDAWVIRQHLARVGFQMAREAPLFGVGVGRFFQESARLASPELRQYYAAQNAHNQSIQMLGELGTVGAGLFLALIAFSLIPAWRLPESPSRAAMSRPLILGLVGFLIASLLMHPLLLPEVAAAFWLALGLSRSAVGSVVPVERSGRLPASAVALAAISLAVSIPIRSVSARDAANLEGVGIGLSSWHTDPVDGRRYRIATGDAAIYIDGHAPRLRIAVRPDRSARRIGSLALLLDGQPAGRMLLESNRWTELVLVLPKRESNHPRFRRLDLRWVASSSFRRLRVSQDPLW